MELSEAALDKGIKDYILSLEPTMRRAVCTAILRCLHSYRVTKHEDGHALIAAAWLERETFDAFKSLDTQTTTTTRRVSPSA